MPHKSSNTPNRHTERSPGLKDTEYCWHKLLSDESHHKDRNDVIRDSITLRCSTATFMNERNHNTKYDATHMHLHGQAYVFMRILWPLRKLTGLNWLDFNCNKSPKEFVLTFYYYYYYSSIIRTTQKCWFGAQEKNSYYECWEKLCFLKFLWKTTFFQDTEKNKIKRAYIIKIKKNI